jgi:hypothetical protein
MSGLMELSGNVDEKRLADDLVRFSAGIERLRQRLVVGDGVFARPVWQSIGDKFDIGNHLTFVSIPDSDADLYDDIGRRMETPLSVSNPLWHVTCYSSNQRPSTYLLLRVSVSDLGCRAGSDPPSSM